MTEISNFCPYARKVLKACFNILGIIVIATTLSYVFVGGWIATGAAIYMFGFSEGMNFVGGMYPIWAIGDVITLTIFVLFCIFLFDDHVLKPYKEHRRTVAYDKQVEVNRQKTEGVYVEPIDGFITTWYKANHDKICPRIDW